MKRFSLGNRLTPYLLLTCLVLAGILALEWRLGAETSVRAPAEAPPAAAETAPDRTEYSAPTIEAFSEILERPLFTAGRQPPEEPEVATATTPAAPTAPIRLRLEGVALTPQARVAVVRDLANNQLLRLAEGAEHQGWVVEAVHPTSATLKQGQQTQELVLEVDKKPNPPARSASRRGLTPAVQGRHIGVRRRQIPNTTNQQADKETATQDASDQTGQEEDSDSDAKPAGQDDNTDQDQNDKTSVTLPSHPLDPFPLPSQAQASQKEPTAPESTKQ